MAELARDELVRRAGADGAYGVEVPGIVHPVVRQGERVQPFAVHVANRPPIDSTEQPLAGGERFEVLLDERPRPIGDAYNAIAGMRLRTARAELAPSGVHIGFDATESRGDLHARAIQHGEEGAEGLFGTFDDALNITEIEFDDTRLRGLRRFNVARDIGRKDADLHQVASERLHGREVLASRRSTHRTGRGVLLAA